jgi:hypothetical protein
MSEGDGVTAVVWNRNDKAVTVEYKNRPATTSLGTEHEAQLKAERFFGRNKARVAVFGDIRWVRER